MFAQQRYRWTVRAAAGGAVATVAVAFVLINPLAAAAATTTLAPTAITTSAGSTGSGQSVANLAVKDLSGTTDTWSKYVEFIGKYSGYLSYTVPAGVAASSISAISVQVNYRGPASAGQTWTFKLQDWTSSTWVTLGTNAAAPDWGAWTLLTFNATGTLANYVSSTGAMRVQLVANNSSDAADIDYAAVVLTTSTATTPPPTTAVPTTAPPTTPPPTTVAPTTVAPTTVPPTTVPPTSTPPGGLGTPVSCPSCWHPPLQVSWNWVLSTVPVAPYRNVQMYDIDGFGATAADVTALHNAGKKVVCYLSVGSYENWRPDAAQFPAAILGNNLDGWPGERWLDVRNILQSGNALAQIMNARLDMCDSKGFDAVEFDNMDGYTNSTGFPLTASQQATYNVFLANGARQRGMSAVMKNDLDQVGTLLPYFDMALNEECNAFNECGPLSQFVQAGKPVFNAEYASSTSFCAADNAANINGVNFALDLDDSKFQPCR